MGKRITSNHFAVKRNTFGGVTTVDFKPNVASKTKTAPVISESYVDDKTGDVIHILANGNQISQTTYEAHWGKVKTKIK